MDSLSLSTQIKDLLDDKQAYEITCTEAPEDHACVADYLIVASGNSERQLAALAQYLRSQLKQINILPTVQGLGKSSWVIVDAGSVIIHLFLSEVRKLYNLEQSWSHRHFHEQVEVSHSLI